MHSLDDVEQAFKEYLTSIGHPLVGSIQFDADWQPFPCPHSKQSKTSARYKAHSDGAPTIKFWCGKCDISDSFTYTEQPGSLPKNIQRKSTEQRQLDAANKLQAFNELNVLWSNAAPCTSHPYFDNKQVTISINDGFRITTDGTLLCPIYSSTKELISLQRVYWDARINKFEKRFFKGLSPKGGFLVFGDLNDCSMVYCAEGIATATTVRYATQKPTICVYGKHFEVIAPIVAESYPQNHFIFCADTAPEADPSSSEDNAKKAISIVGGNVCLPNFSAIPDDLKPEIKRSDYNDLFVLLLAQGLSEDEAFAETRLQLTLQPISLFGEEDRNIPFPVDSLPTPIKNAVMEVATFVQCPLSLAATSALGILSLATQGLANVARAEHLEGPINLYLLAIADSGERKTTVDNHFSKPIKEWETVQGIRMEQEILKYKQNETIWSTKVTALKSKLKKLTINSKDTSDTETSLVTLLAQEPIKPREPRIIYEDVTPESLSSELASGWHSVGILSNEGGSVLGGHSMNPDKIMSTLSLLNKMWDANEFNVDRKTSESIRLKGARVTICLSLQPGTFKAFTHNSKGIARNIGFIARFLLTNPKSTQGARTYKDSPGEWIYLAIFHEHIKQLLNTPMQINEKGEINPPVLQPSFDAKLTWIKFHDDVEKELRPGGDMEDVRDTANKSADNAARLAAQFHVFENGPSGTISAMHMEQAIKIVAWYLYDAKRFLSGVILSVEVQNAVIIEDWIVSYCKSNNVDSVSVRTIQQYGPNAFRGRGKGKDIEKAVSILVEHMRLFEIKTKRTVAFRVNPSLLEN